MDASVELRAWMETLADLGVMGLVPEPHEEVQAVAVLQEPPAIREVAVPSAPKVAAVKPAEPRATPAPAKVPDGVKVQAALSLDSLQACISDCLACALGHGRIKLVFGEGNPKADLMFVGEGPGRDEDLQGRPFVGKAGELLDRMIGAIGLSRQEVYIANVVKCRPPDNRTPLPDEASACLPFLRKQIELVRPKVIVTLGATPLRELLGVNQGITKVRGQWQRLDLLGGIPVMPTFHPAYVLRQYTQDVRRAVWDDLKTARAWLDQPGSLP